MAQQNGLLYASVTITLKVGADNIRVTHTVGTAMGNSVERLFNINGFPKIKAWPDVADAFARHGRTPRK